MDLRLNSHCTQRSAGGNFEKLQNGGFYCAVVSVEPILAILTTNFIPVAG